MRDPTCLIGTLWALLLIQAATSVSGQCTIHSKPRHADIVDLPTFVSWPYPEYATGHVVCSEGFYVSNGYQNMRVVCRFTNSAFQWTGEGMNIKCEPKPCRPLGHLEHGQLHGSEHTTGNQVEFSCNEGYRRRGMPRTTCLVDGTWSGSIPICEKIFCAPIDLGKHVHLSRMYRAYGKTTTVTCDTGYVIDGTRTDTTIQVTCTGSGVWSPFSPACVEVRCHNLPLANGQAHYKGHTLRSTAEFTCDERTTMTCALTNGRCIGTCLLNGQWNVAPQCHAHCKHFKLENGNNQYSDVAHLGDVPHGTKTVIQCARPLFALWPKEVPSTVTCNNGTWSSTNASCMPAPCYVRRSHNRAAYRGDNNVTYTTREIPSGVTVTVVCAPGYVDSGLPTTRCEYGNWLGQLPVCTKKIVCGIPVVEHGTVHHRGTAYGNGLWIVCNEGYRKMESENMLHICGPDGNWNPLPPKCTRPESPSNRSTLGVPAPVKPTNELPDNAVVIGITLSIGLSMIGIIGTIICKLYKRHGPCNIPRGNAPHSRSNSTGTRDEQAPLKGSEESMQNDENDICITVNTRNLGDIHWMSLSA